MHIFWHCPETVLGPELSEGGTERYFYIYQVSSTWYTPRLVYGYDVYDIAVRVTGGG